MAEHSTFRSIVISDYASRSRNPLRAFVEGMHTVPIPGKPLIPLSLGDPTIFGNFQSPPLLDEAIKIAVASHSHNGYIPSSGDVKARASVAAYYNRERASDESRAPLSEDVSMRASFHIYTLSHLDN